MITFLEGGLIPVGVWLLENWSSILLTLVTAGLLAFCRRTWKQMKEYKKLLDNQDAKKIETTIETKLEPIKDQIGRLADKVELYIAKEQAHIDTINAGYRYRLIALCSTHLEKGYITQAEFRQLSELYKVYTALGGNGQAHDFYEKTVKLPMHPDSEE